MNRLVARISMPVALIVLAGASGNFWAQTRGVNAGPVPGEVVLSVLSKPLYPPLGRQTRISGEVELALEIRRDGSLQSVNAVRGHPLLQQAALDSARQSQFECRNCSERAAALRLLYTFQLVGTESCCSTVAGGSKNAELGEPTPRVIQLQNHITLIDGPPPCICDPAPDRLRVRSLK